MLKSDAVSKQEVDEKSRRPRGEAGDRQVAAANVDRLQHAAAFKRIVAPFDGIVTARNTDVGALINVGSAAGQELFVVSDTRRLRVYVNVPQVFAAGLTPGTQATWWCRTSGQELRGRVEAARRGQRGVRHHADAARRRQRGRRTAARRFRDRELHGTARCCCGGEDGSGRARAPPPSLL